MAKAPLADETNEPQIQDAMAVARDGYAIATIFNEQSRRVAASVNYHFKA
jgi:hypothetical protein